MVDPHEDRIFDVAVNADRASYAFEKDARAWVLLELTHRGSKAAGATVRVPADIFLVLDVSASMDTTAKYPRMRKAVEILVKQLAREDRLSIILFSRSSFRLKGLSESPVHQRTLDETLRAMDEAPVTFLGPTHMATGLLEALEQMESAPRAGSIRRVCCLTDGELHDLDACISIAAQLREARAELHIYGFGDEFNAAQLSRIVEGMPGSSVKPLVNTEHVLQTFSQLAHRAADVVAFDFNLSFRIRRTILCGDVFQFRPQERCFGRLPRRGSRLAIPSIERDRTYSFLLEVRLPATDDSTSSTLGVVEASFRAGDRSALVKERAVLSLKRSASDGAPDARVARIRDLLLGLREGDLESQIRRFEARLELAILERRDPELIEALRRKLASLRIAAGEGSRKGAPAPAPQPIGRRDALLLQTDLRTQDASDVPYDEAGPTHTPSGYVLVLHVDGKERCVPLRGVSRLSIGRSLRSDVHVDDPSISREHCSLTVMRDHIMLTDLGSKNGTSVNGRPLSGSQSIVPGDVVRLGPRSVFTLRDARPGASAALPEARIAAQHVDPLASPFDELVQASSEDDLTPERVLRALEATRQNRTAAARYLGVTKRMLTKRICELGLDVPSARDGGSEEKKPGSGDP
jgi:hypothetical protein